MSNLHVFELFKQVSEKNKQIDTYMTFAENKPYSIITNEI